jgi:hypothetical protein
MKIGQKMQVRWMSTSQGIAYDFENFDFTHATNFWNVAVSQIVMPYHTVASNRETSVTVGVNSPTMDAMTAPVATA